MKAFFLYLFYSALAFGASLAMAQYPTFYENESVPVAPEIEFPTEPEVCAPDDQACFDAYLEVYGAQLGGYMTAQQPPSPIYSWKSGECVLDTKDQKSDKCAQLETEWRAWNQRAGQGGLDFAQEQIGPNEAGLECIVVPGAGWWMDYVYHCQEYK